MVFWGKEADESKLPEALRGKTPEQIAQALADATKLQEQVTALTNDKTALEAKYNEQQTQFTQLQATVEELKASQKPPEKTTVEEPASIWTDPSKFVDERLKDTQNAALLSGMLTAKLYAKQGLSARDTKIWNKYDKEIDQIMNGFTPQQRILPQSWLMALTLTKGNHESEISAAERSGTDFFAEGGTGTGPKTVEPDAVKLTPEEEEACRKFRWDPKRYLEQKKTQVIAQSEKGAYAHFTTVPSKS